MKQKCVGPCLPSCFQKNIPLGIIIGIAIASLVFLLNNSVNKSSCSNACLPYCYHKNLPLGIIIGFLLTTIYNLSNNKK
jgi:hypothetical protein